jgi:hypothetical protein
MALPMRQQWWQRWQQRLAGKTQVFQLPGQDELNEAEKIAQFASGVLEQNLAQMMDGERYIRRSYKTVYWVYIAMLVFGFLAFGAAVWKGFVADSTGEAAAAAALGGLSVATFISVFFLKPVESLERNAVFVPWLSVIMNTYWTRLMYFEDPKRIDQDLDKAARDAIVMLTSLADRQAAALRKLPEVEHEPPPSQG